jgi:hypothetical protein
MFYCEPLKLDLMVQNTSRRWETNCRRRTGATRWLHGRKSAELAGDGGEGTRKLGFRRKKFREQERTIANSPRVLSELEEISGEARDAKLRTPSPPAGSALIRGG